MLTPWPPLRGGSARRRWGRELYGCPKYFGLWQGSLPPPLRGTAHPLAQAPSPPYRGSLSRRGRFFDTLGMPRMRHPFLRFERVHCRGEHCSPVPVCFARKLSGKMRCCAESAGDQGSPLHMQQARGCRGAKGRQSGTSVAGMRRSVQRHGDGTDFGAVGGGAAQCAVQRQ